MIQHNYEDRHFTTLDKVGVPNSAFMKPKMTLDLTVDAQLISVDLTGCATRKVTPKKQLTMYEHIYNAPLKGNPLYVITSFPTESKAQAVAVQLMYRAMGFYYNGRAKGNQYLANRDQPMWHRLMGGYNPKDEISRDRKPCFLVLSNIIETSTLAKWEKLRDILTLYDDIPRIVVSAGCDPLTFACEWLKMQPDGVLYLGPNDSLHKVQSL